LYSIFNIAVLKRNYKEYVVLETQRQQIASEQTSEIPLNVVQDVVSWLTQEIQLAQQERADLTDNLVRWERMYEAVPAQQTKNFPWPGASNLEIPTIATAVETVHSRIMQSIFSPKDVWSAVVKSPEWTPIAEDVTRWINWVGKEVLKLKPIVSKWLLSTVKFGTGVLKETWVHTQKKVTKRGASGGVENSIIDTHYGPKLSTIPLADFYISNDALFSGDVQNCEWVMERQIYTYKQLKALETNEIVHDVDKIKEAKRTTATPMEEEVSKNTGISINEFKDYELWEAYCSYDIDGDGIPEELCVLFHLETMTALKAILNPLYHQERPYNVIRYMPRDNSFYGIGLCQMLEPIQLEVSSMHNRRLDNATLSNTAAFTRVRGSRTGPLEWYPGVVFDINSQGDIMPLQVGQQHSTLLMEEQHTNVIGEKRSGVSDYSVGRESSAIGSRATATSTLALIKEGNVKFKTVSDETRDGLSNVAHQTIMLYQQTPDAKIYYEMFNPKNLSMVRKYFTLPQELSRAGVIIDVPAISEAYNKDIQRQTYMTLMQVMQQFYSGVMQAFQLATSPDPNIPKPMKDLAVQGATSAAKLWGRVLEAFDVVDADTFTPDVETLLGLQALGENLNGGLGTVTNGGQQQTLAAPQTQATNGPGIQPDQSIGVGGIGSNESPGSY
jgi:hypothetical protein